MPVAPLLDRARDEVLRNPARARLMDLIRRRPGVLQSELAADLGSARATVRHHLAALQRAGHIDIVRHAQRAAAFPARAGHGAAALGARRARALEVLQRGRTMDLVALIQARPGAVQSDLTAQLGMSRKVFRKYMDRLVEHALIEEVAQAPYCMYFPTPDVEALLALLGPTRPHANADLGTVATTFVGPERADQVVALDDALLDGAPPAAAAPGLVAPREAR